MYCLSGRKDRGKKTVVGVHWATHTGCGSVQDEEDAIDDEEVLLRRIPTRPDFMNPAAGSRPSRMAFRPREDDQTGLSVFRERYISAVDLCRNSEGKRFYVARFLARDIRAVGMDVRPRRNGPKPGHAEIISLTFENRKDDKSETWQIFMARELEMDVVGPHP